METHDTHMENQVKRHSVTHSARVRFMGHDLNLRSEENPEVIEEVVEIVEKRLESAKRRCKSQVPHQIALLALMDVAGEYVKAKNRSIEHQSSLEKRTKNLFDLIDQEIM